MEMVVHQEVVVPMAQMLHQLIEDLVVVVLQEEEVLFVDLVVMALMVLLYYE